MTRVLERKPIGDLSVADITSEAGVTRSGFYFHFESKYAALEFASAELWSELADVILGGGSGAGPASPRRPSE